MSEDALQRQRQQQTQTQQTQQQAQQQMTEEEKKYFYQNPLAVDYADAIHKENRALLERLATAETVSDIIKPSGDIVPPEAYALPQKSSKEKRKDKKKYKKIKEKYPDLTFEGFLASESLRDRFDQGTNAIKFWKEGSTVVLDGRVARTFSQGFRTKKVTDSEGKETEVPLNAEEAQKMQHDKDFIETMMSDDEQKKKPYLDEITARILSYDVTPEMMDPEFVRAHPVYVTKFADEICYFENLMKNNDSYYSSLPTLTKKRLKALSDVQTSYSSFAQIVLQLSGTEMNGKLMEFVPKEDLEFTLHESSKKLILARERYKNELATDLKQEQQKLMDASKAKVIALAQSFKPKTFEEANPKGDIEQVNAYRAVERLAGTYRENSDQVQDKSEQVKNFDLRSERIKAFDFRNSKSEFGKTVKEVRDFVFGQEVKNCYDFAMTLFKSGIHWDEADSDIVKTQTSSNVKHIVYNGEVIDAITEAKMEHYSKYLESPMCIKYIQFMFDNLGGAEVFGGDVNSFLPVILQDIMLVIDSNFSIVNNELESGKYGEAGPKFAELNKYSCRTLMTIATICATLNADNEAAAVANMPPSIQSLYGKYKAIIAKIAPLIKTDAVKRNVVKPKPEDLVLAKGRLKGAASGESQPDGADSGQA